MKRLIALVVGLLFALTLASAPAWAQGKDKKGKADPNRVSGRIHHINKAASELEVRQGNVHRKVVWGPQTKFTYRNTPGSMENLKEGLRVICLGKFDDQNRLMAERIDLREER